MRSADWKNLGNTTQKSNFALAYSIYNWYIMRIMSLTIALLTCGSQCLFHVFVLSESSIYVFQKKNTRGHYWPLYLCAPTFRTYHYFVLGSSSQVKKISKIWDLGSPHE